jgi:hypothetical protein
MGYVLDAMLWLVTTVRPPEHLSAGAFKPRGISAPGHLSAISVSHSESALHGAFVWARRALNN